MNDGRNQVCVENRRIWRVPCARTDQENQRNHFMSSHRKEIRSCHNEAHCLKTADGFVGQTLRENKEGAILMQ
jgi:hypothetical protein